MVVDTSALLSILLEEPEAHAVAEALEAAPDRFLSAATLVELRIVAEARWGPPGAIVVEDIVREAEIQIVDFSADQVEHALDGWRRFGKGNHPAALNLGDCFAYALASREGLPVVCVGDDFAQTDVDVLPPR